MFFVSLLMQLHSISCWSLMVYAVCSLLTGVTAGGHSFSVPQQECLLAGYAVCILWVLLSPLCNCHANCYLSDSLQKHGFSHFLCRSWWQLSCHLNLVPKSFDFFMRISYSMIFLFKTSALDFRLVKDITNKISIQYNGFMSLDYWYDNPHYSCLLLCGSQLIISID